MGLEHKPGRGPTASAGSGPGSSSGEARAQAYAQARRPLVQQCDITGVPGHIYLHVPFCARRCSYCDFSIAVRREVPVDEYLSALDAELRTRFGSLAPTEVDTIYLGGGTPSRLGGEGVVRALDLLRRHFVPSADAEITIEANPEDVTGDATRQWASGGVNRLSLGAQTFDDRVLTWMHRTHDGAATATAVRAARDAGITNLSLDLIFALPDALERSFESDV